MSRPSPQSPLAALADHFARLAVEEQEARRRCPVGSYLDGYHWGRWLAFAGVASLVADLARGAQDM